MTAQRAYRYTEQEYLDRERSAATKSQFYQGETFAMAGASRAHNLISTKIASKLTDAFIDRQCEAYTSDMRVKVDATGLITYPDISVTCGDEQFVDNVRPDTLLNPLLLIEVLSESTEAYDRGKKFINYQQIASLQEYVLVSQTEARIESYRRQSDGESWLLTTAVGLNSTLELPSIDFALSLADVYHKIAFTAEPPIPEEARMSYAKPESTDA